MRTTRSFKAVSRILTGIGKSKQKNLLDRSKRAEKTQHVRLSLLEGWYMVRTSGKARKRSSRSAHQVQWDLRNVEACAS